LVERTLRRGEADALQPLGGSAPHPPDFFQALERQREVRTALGWDDRVDLIDDDAFHRFQRVPREAGEDEVERLRRGNEDVRGPAQRWRAGGVVECGGEPRASRRVEGRERITPDGDDATRGSPSPHRYQDNRRGPPERAPSLDGLMGLC